MVIGGSATGCETAELLAGKGADVTILEMRGSVGHGIEAITRRQLLRELQAPRACRSSPAPRSSMIEHDHGALRGRRRRDACASPADLVALAIGWRPRGQRARRASSPACEVRRARRRGAARRTSSRAINAGADAGLAL